MRKIENTSTVEEKNYFIGSNLKLVQICIVNIDLEDKNDGSISTSELFPDSCPYNVYRKDRNPHGGGVMLLIYKEIPRIPLMELENDSESVWAKVFANKTSPHYIASWYREPSGLCKDFQLLRNQLERIKSQHKKLPSVHILGDFNFRDIVWPDRQEKWDHVKSVRGPSTCGRYERLWAGTAGHHENMSV